MNLFIEIEVQDGERRHTHKNLIETKCKNAKFAAEYYTAHFWGYGTRDFGDDWWWWGDFAGRLSSYIIVTDEEYEILKKFI